jgi:hypothetical protein
MRHPIQLFARRTVVAAVLVTVALALVPTAFGDPWGRDHADAVAIQALPDDWGVDPAIRAAINAHSAARSAATSPSSAVVTSVPDQGFAWGDAFVGAAVGVAVMCVALGCVTLLRHDGRLRSA